MLNEHKYKPFEGSFLSLGKQTITITNKDLTEILANNNFLGKMKFEKDEHSRAEKIDAIDDVSLFRIFKNLDYKSADYSNYEQAHFLIDLNKECPKEYEKKFDVIFSGGTLDNIFNPAQGLINIYKMLKPVGRAIINEASAYHAGVYCGLSPEWFASFFAVNNCVDVQVYTYCIRNNVNQWIFDSDLFKWSPHFTRRSDFDYVKSSQSIDGQMYSLVIAEKSIDIESEINIPIQSHYVESEDTDWMKIFDKYQASKRTLPPIKVRKKMLCCHY